jgi:hypothetical protein
MSQTLHRGPRHRGLVVLFLFAALMVVALPALAAKGGNHRTGGGGKATGTLDLEVLNSSDQVAHYGDQVTFTIVTSVSKPLVAVNCYQGGSEVYAASAGFYPEYPWPQDQIFTLRSSVWTGGTADCTARLYYSTGNGKFATITTLPFQVQA